MHYFVHFHPVGLELYAILVVLLDINHLLLFRHGAEASNCPADNLPNQVRDKGSKSERDNPTQTLGWNFEEGELSSV